MALGLTEDHQALASSVHDWARRHSPSDVVRAAAVSADRGTAHYVASLAPGLARQGLLGLHVAAEHGGQGYGLPELTVAMEQLGRALAPGLFLPTVLASAVLAAAGGPAQPLAGLADGSRVGAVALTPGLTGSRDSGAGLVVRGVTAPVLGGSAADVLILPVQTDAGESWVLADAADLRVTELDGLDLTRPLAEVAAAGLLVADDRVLTGLDRATVRGIAAVLFGAEACGIADWAVRAAAEYARTRVQFGRPIGQFQGVKHRCARMLAAAEQAAAAVWDAARAMQERLRTRPDPPGAAGLATAGLPAASGLPTAADLLTAAVLPDAGPAAAPGASTGAGLPQDEDAAGELAACVAAVVSLDAAVTCTHEAIQVFGGIGYTWEHDAHLYYRRALSLRALLGRSGDWAERAGGLALAGVRRPLEVDLPGPAEPAREVIRAELTEIAALEPGQQAARLASGGWVMPHLPRPWGRTAGPLEQLIIADEMRAAGLHTPLLAIGAWVVPALVAHGTPAQQDRFLPPTLRGELLWCQLFSEPGAGSDLAGVSTRAERADGGWRLTGQKIWTSLARQAGWAICIARTDPSAPRHDGISYLLVDMSSPGIEVRPLREMTGEAIFNQVYLDDVFVPDECVVGEVNDGWRVARTTLANERLALSATWGYGSGVAELLDLATAGGGTGSGRLHAADLAELGRLYCDAHAVDVLGLRAAHKQLSGTDPGATASVRKLLGMWHAQRVADFCWAMLGPDGALAVPTAAATAGPAPAGPAPDPAGREAPGYWSRQVLFTRALTIGGGTTDIQLNIIGERLLGLPRDPEPAA